MGHLLKCVKLYGKFVRIKCSLVHSEKKTNIAASLLKMSRINEHGVFGEIFSWGLTHLDRFIFIMLHDDFFAFCSISEIRNQQELLLKSMMEFSNGKIFYTDSYP